MTVGEVCNREVVFVRRDESIGKAARLMRTYHVGGLVVIEEKEGRRVPVGIVTDRDLVLEVIAEEVDASKLTVGDIMSFELVTAREEDSLLDAIKHMRSRGVRRIPVVNREGALTGILAVDDLLELLAEQINDLAGLIQRELKRERERRR
jgi:CBS domain-containing protein